MKGTVVASWMTSGRRLFGDDVVDKAFEKFDSFTPETANSPHWGKGMAEYLKKLGN